MKKVVLFLLVSILLLSYLWAVKAGEITNITGDLKLFMKKTRAEKGVLLKKGMSVDLEYFIQSGKNTEAEILLDYQGMDTVIRLRKNSLIKIVDQITNKKRSGVFLYFGRLWSLFSGKKKNGYAVETFNSVAGVEGTEFEVSYNEKLNQTILKVNSGKVRFSGKKGILPGFPPQGKSVIKDQISVFEKGKTIKLFKDPTSKKYKYYLNEMKISFVDAKKEEIKGEVEESPELLSLVEEIELVCDDEDGINLDLKFLKIKNFDSESTTALNCIAYVWIDGCNFYNEKRMIYTPVKPMRINNISRTLHSVTVLCGGFQHTFEMDLSAISGKKHTEKVRYFVKKFGFRINQPVPPRIEPDEVVSGIDIFVNGQLLKLKHVSTTNGLDPIYACIRGRSKEVNFYYPISEKYLAISIKSEKYKDRTINFAMEDTQKGVPHIGGASSIYLTKKKR